MTENYNETGFTIDEIDALISILNDPHERLDDHLNDRKAELLVEALEFFRETHYIG